MADTSVFKGTVEEFIKLYTDLLEVMGVEKTEKGESELRMELALFAMYIAKADHKIKDREGQLIADILGSERYTVDQMELMLENRLFDPGKPSEIIKKTVDAMNSYYKSQGDMFLNGDPVEVLLLMYKMVGEHMSAFDGDVDIRENIAIDNYIKVLEAYANDHLNFPMKSVLAPRKKQNISAPVKK